MSALVNDGNWAVAKEVSNRRKSPPFPEVNAFYILEQDFMQFRADFTPLALGTAHASEATYQLVSESPLQEVGSGLVRWTRRYAQLPANRILYEGFAYTFPSLIPGGIYAPITLEPEGVLASGQHTIESVTEHGYIAGDFVVIRCAAAFFVEGNPFAQAFFPAYREVLNVDDDFHFTVDQIPGNDPTFIYSTKASDGRDELTKQVISKIVYDYHVVTDEGDFDDIEILTPYTIIDGTGKESNALSFGSTPSQSDYIDDVVGEWIVAENSIVRQWEGQIYERATRYVRAE